MLEIQTKPAPNAADKEAMEHKAAAKADRATWVKTAKAQAEQIGDRVYVVLKGPQSHVRSGCGADIVENTMGEAIAAALDYCDARGIRITDWTIKQRDAK